MCFSNVISVADNVFTNCTGMNSEYYIGWNYPCTYHADAFTGCTNIKGLYYNKYASDSIPFCSGM